MARIVDRQASQLELMNEAKKDRDYRGFASLDSCEHRDIELTCRLLGLLDGQPNGQVNIQSNTVWLMPGIPSLDADSSVIDIASESV